MSTAPLTFAVHRNANPMPEAERVEAFRHLGFGTLFSDHMAIIDWHADRGWHSPRITARAPFQIDPAGSVLHYAQEIFEGMKAYRDVNGRIVLFRPDENAKRFNASARRMAMPELPEADFLAAIEQLLAVDAAWIPEAEGASLYLRPFMFASEAFLGVRPSRDPISRAAPSRSRSGCRRITPAPRRAARGRRNAAATMPAALPRRPRPAPMAVIRWCFWTRPSGTGSKSWAA
jgi:branched-chain amino acid aminotransferase